MSDKVVYPVDKLRQIAQKIRANAMNGITAHTSHWNRAQQHISQLPGFMQSPLNNVLDPHEKSLRDSYQWQLDYADALDKAADQMENLDQQVKNAFS